MTTQGGNMKSERAKSIAEAFPIEQARCRQLLTLYQDIGPPGTIGAAAIEAVLQRADTAMASGDLLGILHSFQEMKGCA